MIECISEDDSENEFSCQPPLDLADHINLPLKKEEIFKKRVSKNQDHLVDDRSAMKRRPPVKSPIFLKKQI